jgi:hemerythrin
MGFQNSSGNAQASKGEANDINELFGSLNRHEAPIVEEEEEQLEEYRFEKLACGKKCKHEGEFKDLFAKLKKQRAAKAEKQVNFSVAMVCILQQHVPVKL